MIAAADKRALRAFANGAHAGHAPSVIVAGGVEQSALERPERADAIAAALRAAGHLVSEPPDYGLAAIRRIHSGPYLAFLRTAHDRWQARRAKGWNASATVQAPGFSLRHLHPVPDELQAQAGCNLGGGWAPIDAGTWAAAVGAAHAALAAAETVIAGADIAYALCRPPGHHAYADLAGGFCYLNNAAIAAERLAAYFGRVAILDIDAHHGNGTQGIFYDRGDIEFVSVHADPGGCYPLYCGYAGERGTGRGFGHNLNLPLPRGSGDERFLGAIDDGLGAIGRSDPAVLVVSLGLDAHEADPAGEFGVTTTGFRRAGDLIAGLNRPTVLVQEGGDAVPMLGEALLAFIDGFLTRRPSHLGISARENLLAF